MLLNVDSISRQQKGYEKVEKMPESPLSHIHLKDVRHPVELGPVAIFGLKDTSQIRFFVNNVSVAVTRVNFDKSFWKVGNLDDESEVSKMRTKPLIVMALIGYKEITPEAGLYKVELDDQYEARFWMTQA